MSQMLIGALWVVGIFAYCAVVLAWLINRVWDWLEDR